METVVMKHKNLLCALSLATLMLFAALPGSAQSSQKVTVSMRPYKGNRSIVAVKVNGFGPYDFMVDTGSTVTVLDTALFAELGLRAEGTSKLLSSSGASNQVRSIVREITLGCFSAPNVEVLRVQSPMAAYEYRAVRGILGENFLRRFDILIDNQHRTITLDSGDSLGDSLSGERLPISFPPQGYRPTMSVKVQGYGPARLLLDSGATTLSLLQSRIESTDLQGSMILKTVNGSLTCEGSYATLYLGRATIRSLEIVNCQTVFEKPKDSEGTLPTAIFKRIFISHAGSYAIVNPTRVPEKAAVAASY
jgi:hypothetical protein